MSNARENPDLVSVRSWILVLSLYTAGWLALLSKFLVDNFDRELQWIGAWAHPGCVVVLGAVAGPLLTVVVLTAGPVSPWISEETKRRSIRRSRIFLLMAIIAGASFQMSQALELGRLWRFGVWLLAGWIVLMAPWVGLYHRWFTGDAKGSF